MGNKRKSLYKKAMEKKSTRTAYHSAIFAGIVSVPLLIFSAVPALIGGTAVGLTNALAYVGIAAAGGAFFSLSIDRKEKKEREKSQPEPTKMNSKEIEDENKADKKKTKQNKQTRQKSIEKSNSNKNSKTDSLEL